MGKIINCGCKHQWQDKQFGEGKRYANKANLGFVCTVCGKKSGTEATTKKK